MTETPNPFAGTRTCASCLQLLALFLGSTAAAVLLSLLSLLVFRKLIHVPVGSFEVSTFAQGAVNIAVCWLLLRELGVDHRAVLRDWREHLGGDALAALKYFAVYALLIGCMVGGGLLLLRYDHAGVTAAMKHVAPDQGPYVETAGIMTSSAPRFAFLALAILVLAPLGEELFFRRILYVFLRQRMGFALALALSSALFAAVHVSAALFVFPVGLLMGWVYEKRRRLPVNVMLHALINLFVLYARLS
jgi:membrane protease YdiL (CAAX protease family)